MLKQQGSATRSRQIVLKESIKSRIMRDPYPAGTPLEWIRFKGKMWVKHPYLKWLLTEVKKPNIQNLIIDTDAPPTTAREVLFNIHMASHYYEFET